MKKQATSLLSRVHHFYVAIAKFLFYHQEYGIVLVRDPIKIKDAEQYGLSPILLYGLTVAGLPIRWVTYTPVGKPRAFKDVLSEAWLQAKGLRGRPDILLVSRHVAKSSPGLKQDLANIDVELRIADAKNKSLPASLRSAQSIGHDFYIKYGMPEQSIYESILALCQASQERHVSFIKSDFKHKSNHKNTDLIKQWLALPEQKLTQKITTDLDWKPGPWLRSWEASLPPSTPRYFEHGSSKHRTWLLTGESWEEMDEENSWEDTYYDNMAELAKNLIECWPNPPLEIAKDLGITLKKLQWFISGKASLEKCHRSALEELLSLSYEFGTDYYKILGPYVLMAKKPQALSNVYGEISEGGDASPCEIVPNQGAADPSWRYVLISKCYDEAPSIIMSPRGAIISERLPDLLINYEGIKSIPQDFYRDVVSTCAKACLTPASNWREMEGFAKRYMSHWLYRIWQV